MLLSEVHLLPAPSEQNSEREMAVADKLERSSLLSSSYVSDDEVSLNVLLCLSNFSKHFLGWLDCRMFYCCRKKVVDQTLAMLSTRLMPVAH